VDHRAALSVFADIQRRPYRVSTQLGVPADNCYFKGIELLQQLGILGYAVRGRVCETIWDPAIFPAEIIALHPKDMLSTHFFVEVELDGQWRIADPSFQPALAKHGFPIGRFDGTPAPCFPVTKLYTQEESIAYQLLWAQPDYGRRYFDRAGPFLTQLNAWLSKLDTP
jgi:hypothetical protein